MILGWSFPLVLFGYIALNSIKKIDTQSRLWIPTISQKNEWNQRKYPKVKDHGFFFTRKMVG